MPWKVMIRSVGQTQELRHVTPRNTHWHSAHQRLRMPDGLRNTRDSHGRRRGQLCPDRLCAQGTYRAVGRTLPRLAVDVGLTGRFVES